MQMCNFGLPFHDVIWSHFNEFETSRINLKLHSLEYSYTYCIQFECLKSQLLKLPARTAVLDKNVGCPTSQCMTSPLSYLWALAADSIPLTEWVLKKAFLSFYPLHTGGRKEGRVSWMFDRPFLFHVCSFDNFHRSQFQMDCALWVGCKFLSILMVWGTVSSLACGWIVCTLWKYNFETFLAQISWAYFNSDLIV